MAKFDEKAVSISVGKDQSGPDRFSVAFTPETQTSPRALGGSSSRIPRPARVVVQAGPPLWIATYIPPENFLPGFSRQDYEAEALVRVRQHMGTTVV
jgi:hypothetical protein